MKRKVRIIIFCILFLIINYYIIAACMLIKYTYIERDYLGLLSGYEKIETIKLNNKKVKKYLEYNNLKIEDIFKNYTKIEEKDSVNFFDYGKEAVESYISISENDSYVDKFIKGFTIEGEEDKLVVYDEAKIFLKNNNVTNDIELFNLLRENANNKSTVFSSIKQMEINYYIKNFIKYVIPEIEQINVYDGNYKGYELIESSSWREVHFYNDKYNYVIKLGGNYVESEIHTLMGTIIINEEE